MEGSEHLSAVADDVVEIAQDSVQLAEDLLRATKHRYILAAGVGVIALGAGIAIGYKIASKKASLRYEVLLEAEMAKAEEFYVRKYKGEGYETPGEAMATLHGAEAAMVTYKPRTPEVVEEAPTDPTDPRPPVETVVSNIFSDNEWNLEQEKSKRKASPHLPYVISQDEYMEGEPGYEQITLAYYEDGEGVLVDPQDKPIPDSDKIVGDDNLLRFGHGSGDSRVVYVRNDDISVDFEIVKSQGSYEQEVLGLRHSDERRRPRRMRASDD